MVLYDTELNNRDKWISEIKKCTGLTSTNEVIQFALSFTLQSCRNNDLDMYKWKDDCK